MGFCQPEKTSSRPVRFALTLSFLAALSSQASGDDPPSPRPAPSEKAAAPVKGLAYDRELVVRLLTEAKANGDPRRGAQVFRSPQFACLTCHKVGIQGGTVGPDLTLLSRCLPPDQIVES